MAAYTDSEILELFETNKDKAIEAMFQQYYNYVCHAIYNIIKDRVQVEDIAQEVFYEFWKKKENIKISTSLKAYLRRSSVNKALNFIRDQKVKFDDEEKINELDMAESSNAQDQMEYGELQEVVNNAIENLPEKCRIVFSLSRFEGLTYKEIAAELSISTKTVENQISKALKILRVQINPHVRNYQNN